MSRAILAAKPILLKGEKGFASERELKKHLRDKENKLIRGRLYRKKTGGTAYIAALESERKYRASLGVFKPRSWSKEETAFLDRHKYSHTIGEIALALGRSISSVIIKRRYVIYGRPTLSNKVGSSDKRLVRGPGLE